MLPDLARGLIWRAGALNFRDVMLAYGKLSKDLMAHGGGGAQIGLEFSGLVRCLIRSQLVCICAHVQVVVSLTTLDCAAGFQCWHPVMGMSAGLCMHACCLLPGAAFVLCMGLQRAGFALCM